MTTITERMEYASAAALDFAADAIDQTRDLLCIHQRIASSTVAERNTTLTAALMDAAVKVYAVERQCEAMEQIAAAITGNADALKGNTAAIYGAIAILDVTAPPWFKGEPRRFVEPGEEGVS